MYDWLKRNDNFSRKFVKGQLVIKVISFASVGEILFTSCMNTRRDNIRIIFEFININIRLCMRRQSELEGRGINFLCQVSESARIGLVVFRKQESRSERERESLIVTGFDAWTLWQNSGYGRVEWNKQTIPVIFERDTVRGKPSNVHPYTDDHDENKANEDARLKTQAR